MMIILILLSVFFFLSQFIILAWAFRPKERFGFEFFNRFNWNQRKWPFRVAAKFIGVCAFGSFGITLKIGYEELLVFLPESWRFNENGEFVSARHIISLILGMIGGIAYVFLLIDHNEKREKKYLDDT